MKIPEWKQSRRVGNCPPKWGAKLLEAATITALLLTPQSLLSQPPADPLLERNCLACHREQKLPDKLIYHRYLLKYSSPERIEKALTHYLKHPDAGASIMPSELFLRFPKKEPTHLDEKALHESVQRYLNYFDVRKLLRLEE